MRRIFAPGDVVYALWPGSSLYYKATVQSFDPIEKEYVVLFESTEDQMTVSKRSVVAVEYIEGSTRGRSPSPARKRRSNSRTRSTSRSRRRGRSASPSRSKKMHQVKKVAVEEEDKKEPVEVVEQKTEMSFQSQVKEEHTAVTYLSQVTETVKSENSYRRKLRSSMHIEKTESGIKSMTMEKEEKNSIQGKKVEVESVRDESIGCFRWTLRQLLLLFLMLVVTAVCPLIYFSCNSKLSCTIKKLPVLPAWRSLLKTKSFCLVAGVILIEVALFLLPVGKICHRYGSTGKPIYHRSNGIYSLLACVGLVLGLTCSPVGKDLIAYVSREIPSILAASTVLLALLSLIWMVVTRNAPDRKNQQGVSLAFFLVGRECDVSPPWFDLKLFLFSRSVFLISNMLMLCFAADVYIKAKALDPVVVMTILSFFLCSLYHMATEEMYLHAKARKGLLVGFLPLMVLLLEVPFLLGFRVKALLLLNKWSTTPQLVGFGLFLAFATFMFISSNYQLLSFRFNPSAERFKDAQIVITPDGRNLLCQGWWGLVRHPNHIADILLTAACAAPCGFNHFLPWFLPLCVVLIHIYWAYAEDCCCQRKHGKGWEEYRARVPYSMIPYVY